MAIKYFEVSGIGNLRVAKRVGSRYLRLSIAAGGEIRVTIPQWATYQSGVDFALSRSDWIQANLPQREPPLADGGRIGKAHRLQFLATAIDAPSSRLIGSEIRISRPLGMAISHPAVQKVAQRAAIRALRQQSEQLLPQRLRQLATDYGFSYNSVSIKQLTGRWGSCDNQRDIVLNLFLMQLPWQLIDYVLIHELVHTKHLNHSLDFWDEFIRHEPAAKQLRRRVKQYRPVLTVVTP